MNKLSIKLSVRLCGSLNYSFFCNRVCLICLIRFGQFSVFSELITSLVFDLTIPPTSPQLMISDSAHNSQLTSIAYFYWVKEGRCCVLSWGLLSSCRSCSSVIFYQQYQHYQLLSNYYYFNCLITFCDQITNTKSRMTDNVCDASL